MTSAGAVLQCFMEIRAFNGESLWLFVGGDGLELDAD
jgi:hypothetical protein